MPPPAKCRSGRPPTLAPFPQPLDLTVARDFLASNGSRTKVARESHGRMEFSRKSHGSLTVARKSHGRRTGVARLHGSRKKVAWESRTRTEVGRKSHGSCTVARKSHKSRMGVSQSHWSRMEVVRESRGSRTKSRWAVESHSHRSHVAVVTISILNDDNYAVFTTTIPLWFDFDSTVSVGCHSTAIRPRYGHSTT